MRYQLLYWYQALHPVQQWLVKIGVFVFLFFLVAIITRTPADRPNRPKIILNCTDGCGVDPERVMTYNEYQDQKAKQQRDQFKIDKQQLRQEIWDKRGRQKWCREHPQDINCKKERR